ncbi:hypothetical protein EDB84DRAFT_1434046 [Lactarius hengduanensis]|nr:hypothetical protein EDB84DRAFT_1434046 [Lactarius hengduanensis]
MTSSFRWTYGLSRCAGDALCREQKGEGPQAPGRGKAGPFVFNTIDRPDAAPECPGTPEAPLPMTSILPFDSVVSHHCANLSSATHQCASTSFVPNTNSEPAAQRRSAGTQYYIPTPCPVQWTPTAFSFVVHGTVDWTTKNTTTLTLIAKKIAHSSNGRRSSSVELDVTLPENVEVCVLRSSVLKSLQTSVQASMDVCDPLDAGQREGEFESLAQHESEEDLTNVNEEPCLGGSASLASEERHEPLTTTTTTTSPAPAERSTNRRHHTNASTKRNGGGTPTTNLRQERWRGGAATQAATPQLDDDNGGNNGDNDSSDDGNDSSDDSNDSSDDGNNRNDNGNDGSDDGDDSDDATDGSGDAAKAGAMTTQRAL